jgi:hypothetical protein
MELRQIIILEQKPETLCTSQEPPNTGNNWYAS